MDKGLNQEQIKASEHTSRGLSEEQLELAQKIEVLIKTLYAATGAAGETGKRVLMFSVASGSFSMYDYEEGKGGTIEYFSTEGGEG